MGEPRDQATTELLRRWASGDAFAGAEALDRVYQELRGIAEAHLRRERKDHTLQATALVHEAYLRLQAIPELRVASRSEFFALASTMIRRILVDHARAHGRAKRGGGAARISVTPGEIQDDGEAVAAIDLIALDEALQQLELLDARQSRIVELRFFGGHTVEQTAAILDLSPRTVKNEWRLARAWLYERLGPPPA